MTDEGDFGGVGLRVLVAFDEDLATVADNVGVGHDAFALDDKAGATAASDVAEPPGCLPVRALAEAEDFVQAYFEQFPGVKNYLDSMKTQAADNGYVETLLGRRRYFPGLKNQTNRNIRNREEREAINAPIQGTAADIMKIAMLQVPGALKAAGLSARMLLQVHDELVLECPEKELVPTANLVRKIMEEAYKLKIPLSTDARSGPNWNEMSPI